MPWVLRIDSGTRKGETVTLHQGALRVGRTDRAELALSDDTFLSGVHFEVSAEGETCVLRDLNSSNGTTFRGQRIRAVTLRSGDGFMAGQTQFSLVQNSEEEAEVVPADIEVMQPLSREWLLTHLRTTSQPLYAVLDAASDPRVLAMLVQYKCQYAWLFEPGTPPELMSFAPYLVPLPTGSPGLEPLVDAGWTAHWGIYLTSAASPWELLAFLKRLLLVQQPDGQEALFRFYDPRVLGPLLETANAWQWRFLFGAVGSYLLPGEEPQTASVFSLGRGGVERSDLYLAEDGRVEQKPVLGNTSADGRQSQEPPPTTRDRLVLLSQQMAKLEARERDPFLERLLKEMPEQFPERFAIPEQGAEWIRYGVQRPQRYGIQAEGDVRTYVSLMMQLGRDFDVDRALPWASRLLHLRLEPREKLSRLIEAAAEQPPLSSYGSATEKTTHAT